MKMLIKSVYMMKAKYNDMLLLICPESAIFFIRYKSTKVTSMIRTKIAMVMSQYNPLKVVPVASMNIQLNKDKRRIPANNPIIATPIGRILPLAIKAMPLISKKAKAVTPKAIPISAQSISRAITENRQPNNIA